MIAWTLAEGITIARTIEAVAMTHGFHCGIGGSVLHKGESNKDLDIIVYPHKTTVPNHIQPLIETLTHIGLTGWKKCDHEYFGDGKLVYKTKYFGKRIDFFFLQ